MVKSILRNAPVEYSPETHDIDRELVLKNTMANAKLHKVGASLKSHDDEPDSKTNKQPDLKWDEANIYMHEQDKSATMKIDEPKTPFQGAVGDSEYYLPDEEEGVVKTQEGDTLHVDELDTFSLGEPQYENIVDPTVQNERIEKVVQEQEESGEEEHEETAEEKHKRFEELRKQHYHMKGNVLKRPIPVDDDEEDEDEK